MAENRLPFINATGGWVKCGNFDSVTKAHGFGQAFAWDYNYVADPGEDVTVFGKLYAARAGTVVRVINDVILFDPQIDPAVYPNNPYAYGPAFAPTPYQPTGHGSARGGNQVIIRHADGTAFCYCHMKFGSVLVSEGQYVFQGTPLGVVGHTGSTSGGVVHTHFERVSWTYAGPYNGNLDNYHGSSLLSHFRGYNTSLTLHAEPWRPCGDDTPGTQSMTVAQDSWSACIKCASLFFDNGSGSGGACKAGRAHLRGDNTNYTIGCDAASPGQPNWLWCNKCGVLFFGGSGATKCPVQSPAGNFSHSGAGSANYHMLNGSSSSGEHGWRWCGLCQTLWRPGFGTSVCPNNAGPNGAGPHSVGSSTDYVLTAGWSDHQQGWRKCVNCRGLFFGSGSLADQRSALVTGDNGACPATGGLHSAGGPAGRDGVTTGGNTINTPGPLAPRVQQGNHRITLFTSISPRNAENVGQNKTWQDEWRWCSKCQSLFFGPNESTSRCAVGPGPTHTAGSTTDYFIMNGALPFTGSNFNFIEHAGRCTKCQGLVMLGNALDPANPPGLGACPLPGAHTLAAALFTVFRDIVLL